MLNYLFFANIYGFIFWILYKIFLQKSTSFLWSRYYLLVAIIGSLIFPQLAFHPYYIKLASNSFPLSIVNLPAIMVQQSAAILPHETEQNWVLIFYFSIVFLLLSRLAFQYITMLRFLREQTLERKSGYKIALNTQFGPGSFFNIILLPTAVVDERILRHEIAHIRYLHFFDKLVVQIIICFFPFIIPFYFMQNELELVHEYQADAAACSEPKTYAALLLNQHFETKNFTQTVHFFHHPLKNRIMMLSNQKKLNRSKCIALLLSLSAFVGTLIFFQSCKEKVVPENDVIVEKSFISSPAIQAEYKGGIDSLYAYLGRNISYPAGDTNQGIVRVRFIINENGEVTDVTIVRGVSPRLDSAASDVIAKMPKWIPAKNKDGVSVKSYYNLPINFQLK